MTLPQHPHSPKQHWLIPLLHSRFFWLFACLIAFIIFGGEVIGTSIGALESAFALVLILLAVTFATRSGTGRRLLMLFLSAVVLTSWCLDRLHSSPVMQHIFGFSFLICLLLSLTWTLQFVLGSGAIRADHILAAICAYIFIAMIFATVYTIQRSVDPAAFNGISNTSAHPWGELFYFSFTTLSTVGYGDIVPVTFHARSFCMIEQLTGTFYVAILIARLASVYAPSTPPPSTPQSPTPPPDDALHPPPSNESR